MGAVDPTRVRPPAEDASVVSARIGQAWKELRRGAAMGVLRERLFGAGDDALEPGQFDTLELLAQRDTWRMGDLADALRVDPSTATRAVQRLVKTGLAERHGCSDDGRVVRVSATAEGRRRHQAIAASRRDVLERMLDAFAPSERVELAELMERLVRSLDDVAREVGPLPVDPRAPSL